MKEQNISGEQSLIFKVQAETLRKNFQKRRLNLHICETREQGKDKLLELALEKKKDTWQVGFSDSVSLHQMEIFKEFEKISGVTIIDPFKRLTNGKYEIFKDQPEGKLDLPIEEYYQRMEGHYDLMRKSTNSDVFICGANAITMQGQIVSTDGTGNRVSGMIFGPERVIIVVGRNKICKDLNAAIDRNRNIAAPLNYHRHNIKHHNRFDNPCMKLGYCVDCNSPRRACLKTVIIDGEIELKKDRIHVILINEDMGL
jgi:LUD domain